LTASLNSKVALPAPNSVGSTTELKGPFRGRLLILSSRFLSSELSGDFRFWAVVRETTAGTAERCANIFVDVSSDALYFGRELRTKTSRQGCIFFCGGIDSVRFSSPLTSITKSWSSCCLCRYVLSDG
jgi:hypothetical protein